MTRTTFVLVLLLGIVLPVASIDIDEIMRRGAESLLIPDIQGTIELDLVSESGETRHIEARAWQKHYGENQNDRLFLVDFPPAVRGTGLLLHSYYDGRERNMWIYLPAVRRVKRIALESSGTGYFMGSDFTYQDMMNTDYTDKNVEYLGDTEVNGMPAYIVKAWGKTPEDRRKHGYDHIISYYHATNFLVIRREYYDLNGDLLKFYDVEDFLDLHPHYYPTRMVMQNVQTGHKSILVMRVTSTDPIPDRYFTTRFLQDN